MLNAAFLNVNVRPKLKNLFPAPERPLENVVTRNIFLLICYDFFFFLVTGNRDWKFQYCSRIYVRNWFTLLNEQSPLLDFEGTRFVNERSLFWKKIPSTYQPIGEMEGRVWETNIFLRVALVVHLSCILGKKEKKWTATHVISVI